MTERANGRAAAGGELVERLRAILLRDPTIGTLLVLLVVLAVVFSLLKPTRFPTLNTLQAMAFQLPELGILALAMVITLLAAGINLAIIATANLCALTMAAILIAGTTPEATGIEAVGVMLLAVAAGVAVSLAVGALNGAIIAYAGVSPILATLGTMTLVRGIAIGATHGDVYSGFPEPILFIGNGTLLGVPMALLIFLACMVPLSVVLNRTPFGISLYMIGSNAAASLYSGIDVRRVTLKLYVLSSFLCSIAALIMMSRFNSANASYGESYLLITILAAVLGGVDPFGGFGRMLGLFLALAILQVISTGFNLLGFSQHLSLAIWGGTLVLSMAVAYVRARLAGRLG